MHSPILFFIIFFQKSISSISFSRFLFFVDHMSLCCALTKGRSSSPHLLSTCRTLAAYALACGLKNPTRWIASEHNPADLPSRVFASSLRHAALHNLEEARRQSFTEEAVPAPPSVSRQRAGPGEEAAPSTACERGQRPARSRPPPRRHSQGSLRCSRQRSRDPPAAALPQRPGRRVLSRRLLLRRLWGVF